MVRLAMLASVAAFAAVAVSSAQAALFFLFKPTTANAGDLVTVRLGGTPSNFTLADREKPFRQAIRLYLVRRDVAGEVGSRFDPRLSFVGRIVPDTNARGVLTFRVPPLDTGPYALAYWCPGCARFSRGVRFGVQTVPAVSRFRSSMGLRVRMPSAAETCPVTGEGTYGNGLLSVWLPPDGVLSTRRDDDGLFQKLGWLPQREVPDTLTVRGERLDDTASPPMKVLGVFWGYSYVGGVRGRGSWASAVKFPSAGCWRITGRVQDVSLSYVVKVVAGP